MKLFIKAYLVFVIVVSFASQSFGQDILFAKKTISDLCSQNFYGRGYTHKGVNLAAKYIADVLSEIGAEKVSSTYFQDFEMPVCIIKGLKEVVIGGKELKPGLDFVIHPGSKSCSGEFDLLWLTKENIKSLKTIKLTNTFLVIDTALSNEKTLKESIDNITYTNPYHARGIITLIKKETMQIQQSDPIPWVSMEIKADSVPNLSKTIKLSFSSELISNYKTQNVISKISGDVDTSIVFTAHYDHLGELGTAYFPGANDNASGITMLLDICKTFSKQKPHYTLYFIFFTGEEIGLIGSSYFVKHPLFPLDKIRFLLNLDVIGSGEDGITMVNSSVFTKEYNLVKQINEEYNYVPVVKVRGTANNSDHAPFYNKGVKSFFVYAQGKTGPYHNPNDTPENLSLGKYENIVKLLIDFVNKL